MQVIPSIDLDRGRSRVVYWPGASAGIGAPTDRPDRIAEAFVERGARVIHLVDFDGARTGQPGNLEAVGAIASRVAVPLQVAGGVDTADGIRLAFAAGATRVVTSMAIADDPVALAAGLEVAGAWLAVGIDPRPERLAAFPWHRAGTPSLEGVVAELAERGVSRFVLAHGGRSPDLDVLGAVARRPDVDLLVAGGASDLDGIRRLRDAGIAGIILGEALLSGAIEFTAAQEAAA
ncbi:MAG TPA: HisA/HisF-related TIM barrel protein [Candidatus Limnocylindrales bacterium]|nr:HisA/HisF-related TIM barrel protein [Candidatus Limnocylindrales bacterium]